jgi:hypothetical protein
VAISDVQIANFALSKIGDDSTIESLTENSAQANECNLWFDHSRKQTLSAFSWSFAKARITLATHGDDPPANWGYRYQYPSATVKARFIENPAGRDADPVEFVIETSDDGTRSILTDLDEAKLIFTKDITDPSLYSEFFIEALAAVLASHIAYALTGKIKLQRSIAGEARFLLSSLAPALDAVEGQDGAERDSFAIRGRQ